MKHLLIKTNLCSRLFDGKRSREGVATIPLVLALIIFIMAISAVVSVTSFNEATISKDFLTSAQALGYAKAGAHDALIKIARSGSYTSAGYNIDFVANGCADNTGCATVTVTSATSPKTIVSQGRVNNNIRKVQVVVTLDSNWTIISAPIQELTN